VFLLNYGNLAGTLKNFIENGRTYGTRGISPQRTQRGNVSYENSVSSVVKPPQKGR
jgi:hypothetical protein